MSLENFIAQLNSLAFFHEFTFAQNTFKPSAGGSELELADNIVWMGKDLTVLQLKERSAADSDDPKKETRWFQYKVLKQATKQIRDTLTYLDANPAIKVTNARGHSFQLQRSDVRTITKIIVYLPGKSVPDIARATRHYVSNTGGFIHILDANDYLEICRTLRVPADIRDYFSYRQRLFEREPKLDTSEPLIMGQYLSGDDKSLPSKDSYKFLQTLAQNHDEYDLSDLFRNIHRQIETQKNPYDYYEILRQYARLPRSGWKQAKQRLAICLDVVREGKFCVPLRFAFPDLSLGLVFVPFDAKLAELGNVAELLTRGVMNFTLAHKYDQKLECCVGVAVAKDGTDTLLNWCVINEPWQYDPELEENLKKYPPFKDVEARVVPRHEFKG